MPPEQQEQIIALGAEHTGLSPIAVAGIVVGGVALVGAGGMGYQWWNARANKEAAELKVVEEVSAPPIYQACRSV